MKLPEGIDMTLNGNEKEGLKKLNIQVETEVDPQLLRNYLDEAVQQLIQTYILMNFTVAISRLAPPGQGSDETAR